MVPILAFLLAALSPALPAETPFREEIERFVAADHAAPPPLCPVLFVGSSSIRLWSSLEKDFAPLPVLNRGFGGSTIAQVVTNFDYVAASYRPRAIVFYAGENDLDGGTAPQAAAEDFGRFMALKRKHLGDVPVFYISAKPSKARLAQIDAQRALNAAIAAEAAAEPDLEFVDIVPAMLDNGRPKDLFVEDGLHMNAAGYAIWREKVTAALRRTGADRRTCD